MWNKKSDAQLKFGGRRQCLLLKVLSDTDSGYQALASTYFDKVATLDHEVFYNPTR